MNKILTISGAVLILGTLSQPVFSADKYVIDPQHTTVNFTMRHSIWGKYQGTVRHVSGSIVFDKENIAASSVQVEIPSVSVDTLDKDRDAELQGSGFLNATEFPTITFVSTGIEKTGEKTGKIVGNLTMAGVTKPTTIDAIFNGEGRSSWDGKMRIGFSATGGINTNDFGMTGLPPLDIGPSLDFTIEVEATIW